MWCPLGWLGQRPTLCNSLEKNLFYISQLSRPVINFKIKNTITVVWFFFLICKASFWPLSTLKNHLFCSLSGFDGGFADMTLRYNKNLNFIGIGMNYRHSLKFIWLKPAHKSKQRKRTHLCQIINLTAHRQFDGESIEQPAVHIKASGAVFRLRRQQIRRRSSGWVRLCCFSILSNC